MKNRNDGNRRTLPDNLLEAIREDSAGNPPQETLATLPQSESLSALPRTSNLRCHRPGDERKPVAARGHSRRQTLMVVMTGGYCRGLRVAGRWA
jgi:hypothetical protein